LLLPAVVVAAEEHPVEAQLRRDFSSVSLDSRATFDAADAFVNGRMVQGLRAHFAPAVERGATVAAMLPRVAQAAMAEPAQPSLQVLYPRSYDGLIVVELGKQRVVLRATGASGSQAVEANGKLVYSGPYASTDAVEVPRGGRSEELLLLRDERAPRTYEYEIVETEGVAAVALDDGAVRFLPKVALPAMSEVMAGRFTHREPSLQIDRPWLIDAAGRRSEKQAAWTLIGGGAIPKGIRLTLTAERLAFPIVVDPSFSATGSLGTAREYHTATLLPNGKVLIAGGSNGAYLSSAELYDPTNGTFIATGSLGTARDLHTTTLLPNGKVLIAGGYNGASLTSAQLYDPTSGTFTATGSLGTARYFHTATLLPNGKVLIAAGLSTGPYLATAELYDPTSGAFSATGSLGTARSQHTATLLPNGKVLIAGGDNGGTSAELYDPTSGIFSATGPLGTARYGHTATLLPNGKVLIAAGLYNGADLTSAELYDPTSGIFSVTGSLATARESQTATLLPNGKVLIAGGYNGAILTSAELYDPTRGTFAATGPLGTARVYQTAMLLPNAKVLIAGGAGAGGSLASTELYDPTSGTFSVTGSLGAARQSHTATLVPNGKVLIAGGYTGSGFLTSAELYDVGNGFADARRPVITSAPASLALPSTLTLIGNGFRGDSEASSGGTNSSATNYPIVQLQRIDNEQTLFVAPIAGFTDVGWSASLNALVPGWYRATVFTNAIPSVQQLIAITTATPTITNISPNRGVASGGQTVTITGTNLGGVAVTIGGNFAPVTGTTATSATFITPAHAPGAVDVTVTTTSVVSATATGGYTYVANPPTNVVATAATTTSVLVTWTAAPGATAYQVLRSADGVNYTLITGTPATTATDFTASPNTAYLYAVRASAPNVSDNSTPDLATTVVFTDPTLVAGTTVVKAVHFTELRTAVNAVRTLAGLTPSSYPFTDPTITPGVTIVKAAHVTELRTALDAARSALSLPAISYSHATLTTGVALISAADITELRNGTQ
jgi:WD40 repeat protein